MEEELLDWEENTHNLLFWKHMICGSCAGVVEHSISFPFDTIKTFAQAESTKMITFSDTAKLVRKEGILRMWHGVSTVICGCVPAHAAYFSIYEFSKSHFDIQSNSQYYLWSTAITGALASTSHDIILNPMDVVKQRVQLNRIKGPFKMMLEIIKTEGFFSLYRSLLITILMNWPNAALFMTFYENLKSHFFSDGKVTMLGYFSCAGISSALAAGLTTPLDVIKTRLQTQNEESPLYKNKGFGMDKKDKRKLRYKSIYDTAKLIYLEDGALGFVKGIVPRMLFFLPGAAVSWSVYEYTKRLISKY
ncbi:unnamed protein product [Blepharisma stoltei]|uniref:Mitochondrial carrier protein n=1 Tax=Blepharisma stoltei TaxID=1481888 RepID=A0AAU9JHM2_9CILI|nr:unnamed protein product [Blepharisma stoltei]